MGYSSPMRRWLLGAVLLAASVPCNAESVDRRPVALLRVRASTPFLASVAAGAIWDRKGFRPGCRLTCDLRGPVFQAEVGLRGAQLGAGYGAVVADRRWAAGLVSDVYAGVAVKGVVVRTWNGIGLSPEDQWLAGVEVQGTLSRINLTLGLFHTFDARAKRSLEWSGGVGWGF